MRTVIPMNDDWRYMPECSEGCTGPDFDESGFASVRLPHTNIELPFNNFDEKAFQFVSCYRRHFAVDAQPGQRVWLHFEGVMAAAEVYLNGERIGGHVGGYTPFACELTGRVHRGDNVLAVVVDSTERTDIPPFGFVIDYLTYGGIYREVWLEYTEPVFVRNVQVKTPQNENGGRRVEADVYIDNAQGVKGDYVLRFELAGKDGVTARYEQSVRLSGVAEEKLTVSFDAGKVALWSLDDPNLYTLSVWLMGEDGPVDEYKTRFGFRDARFTESGFYLNGERIKLRGLNRHQSYPYVGYAMPKSAQRRDAEILKQELGVNLVRTSHYPQSKHFLDRCDELGLLVFEEIPGWQHIGGEEWKQNSIHSVEEMVTRDWNHPSIVLWGVRINESQDDDALYKATNELARRLDSTRQTGGVRNFGGSHLFEDVYTYNDFIHKGTNEALEKPEKIARGHVPYMVTEHNGHMFPTKKFDCEEKRVEHALRHLRVLDAMYGTPGISGAIGWCMSDYNTHKDFGSGDKICYHGVTDMFRLPKEAAAAYRSQQEGEPMMEVAASMNPGERAGSDMGSVYVFTNCDEIKLYKNGEYIGTYLPDRSQFPNLPHPPVVITDFIGSLMERNEGFSKREAERIKRIFFAIMRYGEKSLPIWYKLSMGAAMLKHRLSYKDASDLFMRYVAGWGSASIEYVFEGYIGGELAVTCAKSPAASGGLRVRSDSEVLVEEDTYDVCRVVIEHVDTLGNVMKYSNEVVQLGIEGAGEIIGPSCLALTGGSTAFWVKSAGEGEIKLTISSQRFGAQELWLTVKAGLRR